MDKVIEFFKGFLQRVSVKEKALFSRQLSTMLSAGLPLTQSIYILAVQTRNTYFKECLNGIVADLEAGYSLHNAIAKYPKVFNRVYTSIVMAGEQSGKLEPILKDLADQLEKDASFNSKIKTAAVYPAFILVVLIGVAFLMLIKVIPQLEDVFKESGAQLPWVTRALMATSRFCVQYWWLVILLLLAFVVVIALLLTTATFRYYYDKFKIHGPVIGNITTGIYMQRFTSTLSMLTASGIPIIEAINIVGEVMNNDIYKEELQEVAMQVERGVPMSVPLSKNPDFPLIVSQMIMVGEQTGKIDKVLENLAKYYEEETDNLIKGATSLFEPVTIVFIGGGVAFLVFAILMPIYNLAQIQE